MYFTSKKVKNSAENKYLTLFILFIIIIGQYFSGLYATACCGGNLDGATYWLWGPMAPPNFIYLFLNQYIYRIEFSNFCSIKLHFASLNNIINSFTSSAIATHFFINFLQTIEVANPYWFTSEPTIYITLLLINNHSLVATSVICKKICNSSIFLIFNAIKKIN